MKHSINDIINIMEQLDIKSGYDISKLPIKYKRAMNSLACCNFRKQLFKRVEYPESFYFSDQVMNMDNEDFKQTIIHEYAHAYVALESLKNAKVVIKNELGKYNVLLDDKVITGYVKESTSLKLKDEIELMIKYLRGEC